MSEYKVLAINPGSTSTKVAVFKGEEKLFSANVEHAAEDLAKFTVLHMLDDNKTYDIGGKETYTYEEIAKMCFEAAGKEPVIKRAPVWLFDVLAFVNKLKKNGKEAIIRFSKFTLTNDMVGSTAYGEMSFAQYIKDSFKS